MISLGRIFGTGIVIAIATIAWASLGAVVESRTRDQHRDLSGEVSSLWGSPQVQAAPVFVAQWTTAREVVEETTVDGQTLEKRKVVTFDQEQRSLPRSTRMEVGVDLDQRKKGLIWYSLYDARVKGTWTYLHEHPEARRVVIEFALPSGDALFDDFHFFVDGVDRSAALEPDRGMVRVPVDVEPGQRISVRANYASRGRDSWRYDPFAGLGVGRLEDFELSMQTDFDEIDFPPGGLSPSAKTQADGGWLLTWNFASAVTRNLVGVDVPQRLQPGELAAAMSFSAPVSLLLFCFVLLVLGLVRGVDVHPINTFFIAAAFFAFHLLFAYLSDHLSIVWSFGLAAATSVFLVVSYLRIVVSPRFAVFEAGGMQCVYLIGFALAHLQQGLTGLVLTVLCVVTLYLTMQLTARVNWAEAFALTRAAAPPRAPEATASR